MGSVVGRPARLERTDLVLAGLLFGLAFAVRWTLAAAPPYGDEGVHYSMAGHVGAFHQTIHWVQDGSTVSLIAFVVGRPLFALLHLPGALAGFVGFRLLGILYASVLSPLVYACVRTFGGRWGAAGAAGLVCAVHPTFVVWGARIFPDSLMAVVVLCALIAYGRGRLLLAAALLVAAVWVKETALGALVGLAVLEASRHRVAGRAFQGTDLRAVGVLALAPLPLLLGHPLFPHWPGFVNGGAVARGIEVLCLSAWLLVPLVVGFWSASAQPAAAMAAGALGLLLASHAARGSFIQSWYAVLPAVLLLVVAALVVEAGLRSRSWPRLLAPAVAVGLLFLVVVPVVGSARLASVEHPLSPAPDAGLADAVRFVSSENLDLQAARVFQGERRPARVFEVDVFWSWVDFPFSGTDQTVLAYPALVSPDPEMVERIGAAAEASNLVWLQSWGTSFDSAFDQTYHDCQAFTSGPWTAYDLQGCAGRATRLREAFDLAT